MKPRGLLSIAALLLASCGTHFDPGAFQRAAPQQVTTPAANPQVRQQRPSLKAFWTGRSELGQSVTGSSGTNCEYNYAGNTFWRMYRGACPSSVDVQ